jgi:hypothetical protein
VAGLLEKAERLRLQRDDTLESNYDPSMEIEEFDDSSSLRLSPDLLNRKAGSLTASSFVASLKLLVGGFEFPANLLFLLQKHLGFSGGVFFLFDPDEDSYVPWAGTGLEGVDFKNLSLSREFIRENFKNLPRLFDGPNKEILRPLFPEQNFDKIENFLAASLSDADHILGYLLFINLFKSGDDDFSRFLDILLEASSRFVAGSRLFRILENGEFENEPLKREELIQEMDKRIEGFRAQDLKIVVIFFDVQNILDYLSVKNPFLNAIRIRKDIFTALSSMVAGIGQVLLREDNRMVILFTSKTPLRDGLLVNQLSLTLKSLFNYHRDFPSLDLQVKHIPDDGPDFQSLLDDPAS